MATRDCPGFFTLSRYLADDLSAEQRQQVSVHLDDCAACQALRRQIEQDQSEYAELGQQHYNAAWGEALARRSDEEAKQPARRVQLPWPKILIPAAALAVLAAVVVPRLLSPPPEQAAYRGFKGTLALQLVAKRGERQFVVADQHKLCPGDALRFTLTAAGESNHLVVFSLDQAGTLSSFYPNEATPPALLAPGGKTIALEGQGRHVLPGSIILDDSLGREVIFLLAAPRPFEPGPLQKRVKSVFSRDPRAAAALGADKLGFSGVVRVVTILKAPCS